MGLQMKLSRSNSLPAPPVITKTTDSALVGEMTASSRRFQESTPLLGCYDIRPDQRFPPRPLRHTSWRAML